METRSRFWHRILLVGHCFGPVNESGPWKYKRFGFRV